MPNRTISDLQVLSYRLNTSSDVRATPVELTRAVQRDGSSLWKVVRSGDVLNRELEWEFEPIPSSRTEDFLQRCRFNTPEEALEAYDRAAAAEAAN